MRGFLEQADAIAADREHGASALTARLLPVLDAALAEGRAATVDVARRVCGGQPAMAPLWNVCAAAVAEFSVPGRFARVRAEVERAPLALVRVATAALGDALLGVTRPQILTLSYSGSVVRTLVALAAEQPLDVVCGESLPGQEGVRCHEELNRSGVKSSICADALLTTYLPAAAAVVVGADAVSTRHWTNKAGTYGLSAAAWFSGVPVYIVASRDKAQAESLTSHMRWPREFEQTPVQLATLLLTDAGAVPPDQVSAFCERFAPDLLHLFQHM